MAQSCDRIVRGLRRRGATVDVLHFTGRAHRRPWTVETQAGGRYLACPVEDDPAHALNRAWSVLSADERTSGVTHTVAFGGSRPIVAGPVYAAWLGVPLVTLIRGNDFDAVELDELAGLLGERPATVPTGRARLVEAVRAGRVPSETYITFLWRQACRDDYLMREASGALRTRTWPALADL